MQRCTAALEKSLTWVCRGDAGFPILVIALLGSKIHELVPDIFSFTDYVYRRFGPVAQVRSAHSPRLVAARWRTTLETVQPNLPSSYRSQP